MQFYFFIPELFHSERANPEPRSMIGGDLRNFFIDHSGFKALALLKAVQFFEEHCYLATCQKPNWQDAGINFIEGWRYSKGSRIEQLVLSDVSNILSLILQTLCNIFRIQSDSNIGQIRPSFYQTIEYSRPQALTRKPA